MWMLLLLMCTFKIVKGGAVGGDSQNRHCVASLNCHGQSLEEYMNGFSSP